MLKIYFTHVNLSVYLLQKKIPKLLKNNRISNKNVSLIKFNRHTYMFLLHVYFFREKLKQRLQVKMKENVHVKTHQILDLGLKIHSKKCFITKVIIV